MKNAGYAHMGIGKASGKDKATLAAEQAISSPLLETAIDGAKGVIINVTASADISLEDIDIASTMISNKASEDANIIWGAVINENMEDEISVTVIATGFNGDKDEDKIPAKPVTATAPVSSTPASTPAPKAEDDDDDTFYHIMSIFNK